MPQRNGFTLIELLVVVSIVGVLSGIGMVVYSQVQVTARDAARKSDLKQLQIALELSYEKKGEYPKGQGINGDSVAINGDCVVINEGDLSGYLKKTPIDPKIGNNYCYKADDKGKEYLLIAQLESKEDKDVLTAQKEACQNEVSKCVYVLASDDSYIAQVTPAFTVPVGVGATGGCGVCITPTSPGCGEEVEGTNGCGNSCNKRGPACPGTPPPPATSSLRVFVTSNTYTGNLGGSLGADQKCQQAADASVDLQGKYWRSWVSGTVNAKDKVSEGKYVLIDNTPVANNKIQLLSGELLNAINLTEDYTVPSSTISIVTGDSENVPNVWTGTAEDGTTSTGGNCAGWLDTLDNSRGRIGRADSKGRSWTSSATSEDLRYCTRARRHIYCFEQPTPSSQDTGGCLKGYRDYDLDGFTTGGPVYFCGLTTLPFGYQSSASSQPDCYDSNPNAKPGQTAYFDQDRGDGSYDYDCDGSSIPQHPKVGQSCGPYLTSTSNNCANLLTSYACLTTGRVTTSTDCGINGSYTDNSPNVYRDDEGGCAYVLTTNSFRGKLTCR